MNNSIVRYWAVCSCGWEGPERESHSKAQQDADEHITNTGHKYVLIHSFPHAAEDAED